MNIILFLIGFRSVAMSLSVVIPLFDQYFNISTPLSIEISPTNFKSDDDSLIELELGTPYPSWISISENHQLRQEPSLGHSSGTESFFMYDSIAYIAEGLYGLKIVDYSDVHNPIFINEIEDNTLIVSGVHVTEEYIYIADSGTGLLVLDRVTYSLLSMNDLSPESNMNDVFVVGDYAYISNGDLGLYVMDISVPTDTVVVSTYENVTDIVNAVYFEDDIAYIANLGAGLIAVNLTNITNPTLHSSWDDDNTGNKASDVVIVKGKYAFVALWGGGLVIIDIEEIPFKIHSSLESCSLLAIYVSESGNITYGACAQDGFEIYDTSNISNPILVSNRIDHIGIYFHTIWVNETSKIAFLGGKKFYDQSKKYIYDIVCINVTNITNPELIGDNPGVFVGATYKTAISLDDQIAYLAEAESGVMIFDISLSPLSDGVSFNTPQYFGRYFTSLHPEYYFSLDIDIGPRGDYACVAAGAWGVEILNITSPDFKTDPQWVGEVKPDGPVTITSKCFYSKNEEIPFVYATTVTFGNYLYIVNITDLNSLEIVSIMELPHQSHQLFVEGDYVYIGTTYYPRGFLIVNVTNKTNPYICGEHSTVNEAYGLVVQDDYAYVAEVNQMRIYDVSNKSNPVLTGSLTMFSFFVDISGDILFIGDFYFKMMRIVDVSDKESPFLVTELDIQGCSNIKVKGNMIYLSHGLVRYSYGGILLEGEIPDNICGTLEDNMVVVQDSTQIIYETFDINFMNCDDVILQCNGVNSDETESCNHLGICSNTIFEPDPAWCVCVDYAFGTNCDVFQCNETFSNDSNVCSGHGDCDVSGCNCHEYYESDSYGGCSKSDLGWSDNSEDLLSGEFVETLEGVFVIIIGTSLCFLMSIILFGSVCCFCEIFCGGQCVSCVKKFFLMIIEIKRGRKGNKLLDDDSKIALELLEIEEEYMM